MNTVYIHRIIYTTDYIASVVFAGTNLVLFAVEDPDKCNKVNISCIPEGTYTCSVVNSPKFGKRYEVKDVPGRTHILFHPGNSEKDTQGCILLGMDLTNLYEDYPLRVTTSRQAVSAFQTYHQGKDFKLVITSASGLQNK